MNQLVCHWMCLTRVPQNTKAFFVLCLSILLMFATLYWTGFHAQYGLDITDESFYLNWMANPSIYPVSISQFGFIYHPLYVLCHGDIALLRQVNIVIMFGLCWLLFIIFFRSQLNRTEGDTLWYSGQMIAVAAIFSLGSFLYIGSFSWLVTPSYNSLIFQALLLVSIGCLLAEKNYSIASMLGWIVIGIAGWLAFMAKPTSAGALCIVTALYLLCSRKINIGLLFLSVLVTVVLLLLTAWIIDGSLSIFIQRYTVALEHIKMMGVEGSIFRIDDFLLSSEQNLCFKLMILFWGVVIYLTFLNKNILVTLGLGISLILIGLGFLLIFNWYSLKPYIQNFVVLQLLAFPISAISCALAIRGRKFFSNTNWILGLFFITLPYVLAIGTSNNYWLQSQLAAVFWILTGLVFLLPMLNNKMSCVSLLPIAIVVQLMSIVMLQAATEHPYRQLSHLEYHGKAAVGSARSELFFPPEVAKFFNSIPVLMKQHHFKKNTPVIDLTGHSPGVLYSIGAKAIGQAWVIGGYPGSEQLAISGLKAADCNDVGASWLLIEPESRLKISSDILKNVGINLEKDYEQALDFILPKAVNASVIADRKQYLFRPTRSIQEATRACQQAKTEAP